MGDVLGGGFLNVVDERLDFTGNFGDWGG